MSEDQLRYLGRLYGGIVIADGNDWDSAMLNVRALSECWGFAEYLEVGVINRGGVDRYGFSLTVI